MNPLLSRLAALRRRVRFLEGWQGICALLTLVVGAALVAGLLDWMVQVPSVVRGLLLAGLPPAPAGGGPRAPRLPPAPAPGQSPPAVARIGEVARREDSL